MKIAMEFDGVVADVQTAWWYAYGQAVERIGLARTDQTTFWRLVRSGAPYDRLVQCARSHHITPLRVTLAEALESDPGIARMTAHARLRECLPAFATFGPLALLTCGTNLEARRKMLDRANLVERFDTPCTISRSPAEAAAAMTETFGEDRTVLVLGCGEEIIRAADEAGLIPVGVASGACVPARLARCGARAAYADLPAFVAAWRQGDEALLRCGLAPPAEAPAEGRSDGSETADPAPPRDRAADREARRQERIRRRRR